MILVDTSVIADILTTRRHTSNVLRITTRLMFQRTTHNVSTMKNGQNQAPHRTAAKRVELGRHIVADPEICHGKPTFKGTRIMVWQVLDDVADGRSWDFICNTRWAGRIPLAAVAEAVRLAEEAWLGENERSARQPSKRISEMAVA